MQRLKGRILFVFSDPGGAKPCLSLMIACEHKEVMAVSDRSFSFYKDFDRTVTPYDKNEVNALFDAFKPDLVFTSTSYSSGIEREFIALAADRGIDCYSFVDHWTSISKRFLNDYGVLKFPDQVWVIDERAKGIAIEEGIPEAKLFVSGNPYHKWLARWIPKISKEEFLSKVGLKGRSEKLIVFAPDPLSNVDGIKNFGFDELTATAEFVSQLVDYKDQMCNLMILIKTHPNQDIDKIKNVIARNPSIVLLPSEIDANETIYFADVIVGFFSSFLIEANIMGKSVIRFLPDLIGTDPFEELNFGLKVDPKKIVPEILKLV